MLKRRYGLTVEELEQIRTQQQNKCAICKAEKPLAVEHDHKTKRVRGLVCTGCNTLIGFVENHPDRVVIVQQYLKEGLWL
ncbi:MAG: endonuclease domain-containing protein [Nitrospiraceae bacterium]